MRFILKDGSEWGTIEHDGGVDTWDAAQERGEMLQGSADMVQESTDAQGSADTMQESAETQYSADAMQDGADAVQERGEMLQGSADTRASTETVE